MCKEVEKISGVKLANNKPVAGIRNYTRESGIGIDSVVKQPLAMYATDPRYFGREGDIVLGKQSGKASIEDFRRQPKSLCKCRTNHFHLSKSKRKRN